LPDGFDVASAEIPGAEPTGDLNHGDVIDLGGRSLEAFHTPGHSPGGVTLLDRENRLLFPGDAVYLGPMFAYRPYSDPVAYRESLRLLAKLADLSDAVYPSHNQSPMTPEDVRSMHRAYESIWSGATPPTSSQADYDRFDFDGFSFWLRPGGYGQDVSS
jgi:glyoxylase-like metal-dependent hydrolase (beta-lactamase superfamily II)